MERKSNVELLRVVCMLMIVLWHINIGFGGDKEVATFSLGNVINAITVVGVNSFVLISGYFGIKFKWKNVMALVLQCLFYSIVISFACHETIGSNLDFKLALLPISSNVWWFMTVYVMLYLSAPLLNKALGMMSLREILYALLSLAIINVWFGYCFKNDNNPSGHSYLQFVFMYVVGRAISYFKSSEIAHGNVLICNSGGAILTFFVTMFANMLFVKSYRYNNPIVVVSSISLFLAFLNLRMRSIRLINTFAATVVAAYLIHEHPLIRPLLAERVRMIHGTFSMPYELWMFLGIALFFIMLGFAVEKVRCALMKPLINIVFNCLKNKRYNNV